MSEQWQEGGEKRERGGKREGSRTIGGERVEEGRGEQRVYASREGGREGCLLVIRQEESERGRVREREKACTYFMGQDCMTF